LTRRPKGALPSCRRVNATLCESAKEQGDLKLRLAAGVVTSQPLMLREGLEFGPDVIFEVHQETGERPGNVAGRSGERPPSSVVALPSPVTFHASVVGRQRIGRSR
jgi:hypothetical protein